MKRPQNTKAAAQRLARVMAHQSTDDDEEEDDLYDFDKSIPSAGIGLAGGRQTKNRPSVSVRSSVDLPPSARPTLGIRPSAAGNSVEQQPSSARSSSLLRPSPLKPAEPPPSHHSSTASRSSQLIDSTEEAQPPSARSNAGRTLAYTSSVEQPLSARSSSVGRPNLRDKTAPLAPSLPPIKPGASVAAAESQHDKSKDNKRTSLDFGTFKYKEPSGPQASSALQDELDMLQEENENLLEKLRMAEERCEEAESRTRQLEQQIASFGEGVSLEARLLSRKEADLQRREAALKAAAETYGGCNEEIAALRTEAEIARDEASAALDQLHDIERESQSLKTMTQRMILTRPEMEEVVLKRSWLARCWSLCVRHGIHAEIAGARYEYWSSLASHPVAVILAAGQKAKRENSSVESDSEEREKIVEDKDKISKRANVESMLLVEKGLRELTSLKVEEAIAITLAQKRRPTIVRSEELKLPTDGQSFAEAFELSEEESEDVLLKQAWLTYFWRRAKNQGVEVDVAEERLQFWINQGNKPPTSHDAVDVERGMLELRRLAIETKLWEETRRDIDPDAVEKTLLETELQMLG
ncbi:coiled-coil domain-containing protein SCD2-like [Sesamum indicum]|uniref:Coiled-coil domain-containing protein SCD2-like n=1 Tax=Sesamum indicum TaxID=4182 RepID=A0A6I9TDU9_SESIN|nr:coiled-coil domain-containing protein SCD2-like [Sesamum indicum]XP_011082850.1 coiled-coil domain-containing protein SCD2-like [Sesamum indicum]XP_011082853.1 coiled-coil domain-containing protein SCD2-like [Sesamum indicum]XP_011082854.1 coiled-coil domain-containing protein SCD2-like [Sesamum indicum]